MIPPDRRRRVASILGVGMIVLFLLWLEFVEPLIRQGVESELGHSIYSLPEMVGLSYFVVVGAVPGLILAIVFFISIYAAWYVPRRTQLAREQLARLQEARHSLASALHHIEEFELELTRKTTQVEQQRDELAALRLANAESAGDLERKLRAMETLDRNRRKLDLTIAFISGVASSIVATYIYEAMRHYWH